MFPLPIPPRPRPLAATGEHKNKDGILSVFNVEYLTESEIHQRFSNFNNTFSTLVARSTVKSNFVSLTPTWQNISSILKGM